MGIAVTFDESVSSPSGPIRLVIKECGVGCSEVVQEGLAVASIARDVVV